MSDYKVKMHDIPENERPQERLLKHGPGYLSNAELLAIVLRTGSKKENVVNMCTRILSEYNIKELSKADVSTLLKIHGVGTSKAAQIASIFELARKLETFVDEQKLEIKSPYDVYTLLYPKIRGEKKEKFISLNLVPKTEFLKKMSYQ